MGSSGPSGRSGRRPGPVESREEILAAARALFAESGYDGATIRAIAAKADVNPALVHHFFGSKDKLFVAAMELPIDPSVVVPHVADGDRAEFGERLVRFFLGVWGDPAARVRFFALLRSVSTNDQATAMMRGFLGSALLTPIAARLGIPTLNVTGIAGQMMGVALLRYVVRLEPLASATDDEVVELVAPAIQLYVDRASSG